MLLESFFHPHVPSLVILSLTLAVLASFVSLELAGRIKVTYGRARAAWLVAAGTAMGGGVWSMHFIAMIALELPFAVAYNRQLTVLSLLIAILVATAGLYAVFWHKGSSWRFVTGGAIMGSGVVAMHYIGMAALIMPVTMRYDISLVVLSVLIAIAASVVALWLAFRVEHLALKLMSALLMGFAAFAMHFTAIAAFTCGPASPENLLLPGIVPGLSATGLAMGVAGTSGAILFIGLALAIGDQRAKRRAWATLIAHESKRRIDALLRNTADLIAVVDRNWVVTYLSRIANGLADRTALGVGADFLSLFAPEARGRALTLLDTALNAPARPVRAEFPGAEVAVQEWFEITLNDQFADHAIQGVIVNLRDITEQKRANALIEEALAQAQAATRVAEEQALALEQAHEKTQLAEEQARILARHDALTGLPNRRVFSAELETALTIARTGAAAYSVLLIDLDEFKKINDLQGHQIGDLVLCEVARRLEAAMRKNDTVARLGGDEFAIIAAAELNAQEHLEAAQRLATRLLGAIRQPIALANGKLQIGASIGIACCRTDAVDVGSLLHAADIAMYRAKQGGKSTFRFFDQSMDDEMRAQESIENDLIRAIHEENIHPHYQPLVDLGKSRIRGFEALARWDHPERGFIPPDVFIPLVEHLGLMTEMTTSILRQACRDARQWPHDIRISVNFSPSEMKDPALPGRILAVLAQEGLAPTRLEVEITESALVSDIATAKTILATLQGYGITICLDDFGTGYSSLYHLRELKFDKLKIDRSFIQSMHDNNDNEMIVDAILGLTRNMNLPTVAEGIESLALQELLVSKGCEYGQGYHFGKAMSGESVRELLAKNSGHSGTVIPLKLGSRVA
jgi:diguanylate cyclase (GGDEF)-like protein